MSFLFKNFKYSILSKITFGQKKNYYKKKYKRYSLSNNLNSLNTRIDELENRLNNIDYEFCDKYNIHSEDIKIPKILSLDETINAIILKKKSISRYGDGEFRYLLGEEDLKKWYFGTDFSPELQKRLIEVLQSNEENHLVCLWDNFGSLEKYTEHGKMIARMYMPRFRDKLNQYLDFDRYYGNLNITRPYLIYKDKSRCGHIFNRMKEIWKDKDIIIIEGEYSKLGIGNNLFDNAKSVKRLLCPSQNAWASYDEIKKAAFNLPKDKLILIALGMTATVLAYDLAKVGYWAVDIGHLDIEYEWFLNNLDKPEVVNGKYTNDASQGGGIGKKDLPTHKIPEYQSQVLGVVNLGGK